MASRKTAEHILGVTVTGRTLHAVLMAHGDEGPVVERRFTRQQSRGGAAATGGFPDDDSGLEETGGDFSISFGDEGGDMDDMFLASEFGGLDGGELGGAAAADVASFALELGDILAECEDVGYTHLTLAFALGSSDVVQTEIRVPSEKVNGEGVDPSEQSSPAVQDIGRKKLVSILEEQHGSAVNKQRLGFIPLTVSEDGIPRFLAVFPKPNDPIESTLREMRADKVRLPSVKLMDTEVSLYLGLARSLGASGEMDSSKNTLILRAGTEDTLVLFLKGEKLHHSENLRSLTAFEAPETICSRVLLLQDEYGIGEINKVLLLSDERESDLMESFEMFFTEANVTSMRRLIPSAETVNVESSRSGSAVSAMAAATRLSKEKVISQAFEDINLLSKELMRRQLTLPVTWHVMALYVLLFCTVLFFIGRYFSLQGDINEYRYQLEQGGATMVDADPQELQARIDSLQQAHQQYVEGLEVLEGLLIGSDKWSRSMEGAAQEIATIEGIWVDGWQPRGSFVQVQGHATSRDRVVLLAERLDGYVETLTFAEIREWPVYSFQMQIPVREELPEAARYLRERVAEMRENEELRSSSVSIQGSEARPSE